MQVLIFVLAILLFIGLVLIHEWGHFWVARRNGVVVKEFGLGFPPRAWAKKLKSGMTLSLNWLPLGGFVNLKGEHDADKEAGSFGAASLGAKTRIMLAGVTMNLLAGIAILTVLALTGLPTIITKASTGQDQFTVARDTKVIKNQVFITDVIPGSPAEHAGLKPGDQITKIDSSAVNASSLPNVTASHAGQVVIVDYQHDGHGRIVQVQLLGTNEVQASRSSANPKGYLGVVPQDLQIRRSTWSAPLVALGLTKQIIFLTVSGIGHALGGLGSAIAGLVTHNHAAREAGQTAATNQVGGPVAIVDALWHSGGLGFTYMFFLIALISLTLALINVLPIPALDGGRLAIALISRGVLRRPLSPAAEEAVVGAGMAVILALIVLITFVDVRRFF